MCVEIYFRLQVLCKLNRSLTRIEKKQFFVKNDVEKKSITAVRHRVHHCFRYENIAARFKERSNERSNPSNNIKLLAPSIVIFHR